MEYKKYLVGILLMFLYIYDINFKVLSPISMRVIIGLLGLFIYLYKCNLGFFRKNHLHLIGLFLVGIVPILITTVINNCFDNRFLGVIFQNILYFFGAYFIVNKVGNKGVIFYTKIIVLAVFLQSALSLIMFVFPSVFLAINSLQNIDQRALGVIESVNEFSTRLVGVGRGSFFSGGVIISVAIILNAYILKKEKRAGIWVWIFLFSSILGLLVARIAIVGILLAFIILFNKRYILRMVSVIISLLLLIYLNYDLLIENRLFNHSFELFINIFEKGNLSTNSTEGVKDMFIFPDNLKTLLIGDGLFYNEDGSYYMHTDIGYLRAIYYYGILGSVIYFYPHFFIVNKLKFKDSNFYKILLYLLVFTMIINFKGLGDLYPFLFIYFLILDKNEDEKSFAYN